MNYQVLLLSSIIFPLVDYVYLSRITQHFKDLVLKITKEPMEFNLTKGVIAYIFLIIGINYFIFSDLKKNNLNQKIIDSIILGLVIYGTFDFTNGTIFKNYDYYTAIMDTMWGGVLFGLVTFIVYQISNYSKIL